MRPVGPFWHYRLYWWWLCPHSYYDLPTYVFIHMNAMFSCSYGRLISPSQLAPTIGLWTQKGNQLYERNDLLMCLNTNITQSLNVVIDRGQSSGTYLRALELRTEEREQSDRWLRHISNSSKDIMLKEAKWQKWMAISWLCPFRALLV